MATAKTNLSTSIREYLTANPKATAKEVVAGLAEKGVKVKEGLVYAVKGGMKEKKKRKQRVVKAAMAAAPSVNGTVSKPDAITMIREVKALAAKAGGYDKLKELVDAAGGVTWMRLITRHAPEFDIFSASIDPALSPYVEHVTGYVERIRALYTALGIDGALWTFPEGQALPVVEFVKPVEYLLGVPDERVIAYIDEDAWAAHLAEPSKRFNPSVIPTRYRMTGILVRVPLLKGEVIERRILKPGHGYHVLKRTKL